MATIKVVVNYRVSLCGGNDTLTIDIFLYKNIVLFILKGIEKHEQA
ncbi:MAG: hypothetical protein QXM38_04325 [Candidatus Aenigmatarchaeota archaeon]